MEEYGDYLYIVLKMLHDKGKGSQIEAEQVSLVLGPNYVFSFQESGGMSLIKSGSGSEQVRPPEEDGGRLSAYTLVMPLLTTISSSSRNWGANRTAGRGTGGPSPDRDSEGNPHPEREMIFLRKAVWPLREVISSLQRGESRWFRKRQGSISGTSMTIRSRSSTPSRRFVTSSPGCSISTCRASATD